MSQIIKLIQITDSEIFFYLLLSQYPWAEVVTRSKFTTRVYWWTYTWLQTPPMGTLACRGYFLKGLCEEVVIICIKFRTSIWTVLVLWFFIFFSVPKSFAKSSVIPYITRLFSFIFLSFISIIHSSFITLLVFLSLDRSLSKSSITSATILFTVVTLKWTIQTKKL